MSGSADLRVVSVSIGSSSRDTHQEVEILGRTVLIERIGTNGDVAAAERMIAELDGKVDAIGLGGTDLFLVAGGRRYYMRDGLRMARNAKVTPVVCGAALKDTLERVVVERLDAEIGWRGRKVLMVAGVDRFGMAEALDAHGADVVYGDLIFALGLPIPLRTFRALQRVGAVGLPVIARLPTKWIYPTGSNQTATKPNSMRARFIDEAEVIAGDFHFIRRHLPESLAGKTILTNTTTAADVEELRKRGAGLLITTTPRFRGRSVATNLLEAALVAIAGKFPLSPEEYRNLIDEAGLAPDITRFNGQAQPATVAGTAGGDPANAGPAGYHSG